MKFCMRSFFAAILIFFALTTHGQQTVYFSNDTSSISKKKKKSSAETNIIKIAPLSFLFGILPVFYERRISDLFSIQAGAGITIKNYMKDVVDQLEIGKVENEDYTFKWNGGNEGYIYDFASETQKPKIKTGTFFSVQPRVYFDAEAMDGYYMGISYENTSYKFSSRSIVTGGSTSNPVSYNSNYVNEYDKYADIAVHFGGQTIYDRLSVEYSLGAAIRSKSSRRYIYGYDNNGNYIDGFADLKKSIPVGLFSFRVGYHF